MKTKNALPANIDKPIQDKLSITPPTTSPL